jgi:hypothetical protein
LAFGLSLACVSTDAATLFAIADDFLFDKILLAFEATAALVFSFFTALPLAFDLLTT